MSHRHLRLGVLLGMVLTAAAPAQAACTNFKAYEFTVTANDNPSAFGIGDGPDRKVKAVGGYAASLGLSATMVAEIAQSIAAGCTQRVEHPGSFAGIWTWNLGKAKAVSSTVLTGNATSRGKTWTFGNWGSSLIHKGVQDEFYTDDDAAALSAVLPATKFGKMKEGDSLVFSGAITVVGESTTGGLYDQGNAYGGWRPYAPFLYIDLP